MEPSNNLSYFVLSGLTKNPKEQKVLFVMFLVLHFDCAGQLSHYHYCNSVRLWTHWCTFFLLAYNLWMSLILLLLPPDLFQASSLGEKKNSLNLAWLSCLQNTFLLDPESFFCWWWPVTTMWPSVSPCIICWSWGRVCVLCCWWCPGLEVFCTQ